LGLLFPASLTLFIAYAFLPCLSFCFIFFPFPSFFFLKFCVYRGGSDPHPFLRLRLRLALMRGSLQSVSKWCKNLKHPIDVEWLTRPPPWAWVRPPASDQPEPALGTGLATAWGFSPRDWGFQNGYVIRLRRFGQGLRRFEGATTQTRNKGQTKNKT